MLFSEKTAELVSLLPIKPFTVEKASRIWKMDMPSAQNSLNELSGRAILGVILKLPPLKQALASQQVKSRYLEALINHMED
jgi:hypothetical protein